MKTEQHTDKKKPKRKPPTYPVGALFRMAIVQIVRTKQALLFAAMLALPVAFSFFVWVGPETYSNSVSIGSTLFILAYLTFIVPFGALFLGSMLIRSEFEARTLTYLVTRPVPRWLTVLVKYSAATVISIVGLTLSFAGCFVLVTLRFGFSETFRDPGVHCWPLLLVISCAAMMVYLALFLLAGMRLRRPIVAGLAFLIIWEMILGLGPGIIRYITIGHYFRSLAVHATKKYVLLKALFLTREAPLLTSLVVPSILLVAFLALSLVAFSRGEFHTNPDK